jgi:alkylation response protein AidB-like acyl-CoA dehydrogenase
VTSPLDRAAALADDVLQPAAAEVDASGVIPPSHFTSLAAAGLYGVALAEPAALPAVTEVLAAGCLATTFTWMQHHGPVRTLAGLGDPRVGAAAAGELRCGVALAGAVPDPPLLWATRVDGGWRLDGQAPLVTGWGLIDLVLVAARDVATADAPDEDALIVTALLDAHAAPGLTARPLALLAADASRTVQLRFDGVHLPDELVTGQTMRTAFLAGMTASARVNGALALGVAGRCVRLIADTGRADAVAEQLRVDLDATRAELDAALAAAFAEQAPDAGSPPAGGIPACAPTSAATGAPPGAAARMATARAAASALAHRAAGALVVAAGSPALLHDHPAGRLVREAAFTLVAAGRAEIRTELLHRLAGCP